MKRYFAIISVLLFPLVAMCSSNPGTATTLQEFTSVANTIFLDATHLTLSQDFSYNDNVDEKPRSHRSGTWTTDTNIDGQWLISRNTTSFGVNFGAGYEHDFHKGENDDGKGFSYYLTPIMNGAYSFGRQTLMIAAESKYENQEIDRSLRTTTMVATNRVGTGWSYQLTGKTLLALTADYSNRHYSKNKYQYYDNQVYGGTFSPYMNLSDRSRLGLTAGIERTSYAHNKYHDDFNRYNFGSYASYQMTGRTDLFVEVGAERLSYQNSTQSRSVTDNDYDPYYRFGVNHVLTESLKVQLALERTTEDSWSASARGERTEYTSEIALDYKVTGKMMLTNQFGICRGDEKTCNGDFREYAYGLRVSYAASESLDFVTGWLLTIEDYDHRQEENYVENEFYVGLKWKIK